jgi:hypothetical protein
MNGRPNSSAILASLGPFVGRLVRGVAHRGRQTAEELGDFVPFRWLFLGKVEESEPVFTPEGGVARLPVNGIGERPDELRECGGTWMPAEGGIYGCSVRARHV